MKIYVCASSRSSEYDRVRMFISTLVDCGHEVTSRWLDMIAVEQSKGFQADADLPVATAIRAAIADSNDIRRADAVVLLVPPVGVYSHGALFELGLAHGLGKAIYSAGDPGRSIFVYLTENYPTDSQLIDHVFSA